MIDLSIAEGKLTLHVRGADKLWAFKSTLEIPLVQIAGVRADPEAARGWYHGIRMPRTNVLGVITAGTFYHGGKRVFWDVHHPEKTIVIDLHDERYNELVVALQPRPRTRANHLSVDVELGLKLSLPLVAQVRWADHAQATSIASVEHFSCDEPGFYRLANADVVRYEHPHRVELQRHDERHELVGTWILRVGRFQRCLQNTSMIPVPMEV